MPHPAIGLVAERVEAILDELAIALQCRLVGIRRHLDRLAPEMQSFGEGKGEVEAVPSSHHPPPPRRIGERDDRHLGEARRRDDALARLHRRTARPVRRDADAVPPRELDPAIEVMPKWPTASAMMRPSRWPEISMWIATSRGHAIGIISSLPCQKARMKGRLSRWKCAACSAPSMVQRLVAKTKRI